MNQALTPQYAGEELPYGSRAAAAAGPQPQGATTSSFSECCSYHGPYARASPPPRRPSQRRRRRLPRRPASGSRVPQRHLERQAYAAKAAIVVVGGGVRVLRSSRNWSSRRRVGRRRRDGGTSIDSCATAWASSLPRRRCATVVDTPPSWERAPFERRRRRQARLHADAPPSQTRRRRTRSPQPHALAKRRCCGDAPLAARAWLRRHLHAWMHPSRAPLSRGRSSAECRRRGDTPPAACRCASHLRSRQCPTIGWRRWK